MSHKPNKFWLCALPVSLLILVGAYYIRVPSARRFIDAHTSLGRELFGSFVQRHRHCRITVKRPPAGGPTPTGISRGQCRSIAEPGPTSDARRRCSICKSWRAIPALWPKKVALKKATTFPAVVGGKVVGSLIAPVGAETNLKGIRDGKVGLEYQGGGAWVAVEETDLEARVMGR